MSTPTRPGPFDVLVLGSGVAGLSAAVRLTDPAEAGPSLGVLTKGVLSQSATRWAQGGVAAVLGGDEDSTDLHLADTLAAGAGLCDEEAVRILVDEGPGRVPELITLGVGSDREASGLLALAREGGHSRPRVVHAGGAATGAEVERALVDATYRSASAVLEGWFALDLIVEGGRCCGVTALPPTGEVVEVRANHVVLATGGAGQLFSVTTNPPESTGDGVAMALRAGVPTADVEFVQFHPTALHHPAMPRPLLSEALRGHGAILRDAAGQRFVDELAPRDVVSRAMAARMAEQGTDHLWLDATGLERFLQRFPTIAASLTTIGLDPEKDWLPIAPAAHHLSGGVATDLWGATALPGLWAVGEVACTGVHGANRLASNSLLEGMVFGARLAERIAEDHDGPEPSGALRAVLGDPPIDGIVCTTVGEPPLQWPEVAAAADPARPDVTKLRDALQRTMTSGAGVVRSAESLSAAARGVADTAAALGDRTASVEAGELGNLLQLADALLGVWPRPARRVGGRTRGASSPTPTRPGAGGWCTVGEAEAALHIAVVDAVARALAEDLGPDGDLTAALVPEGATAQFELRARRAGTLAGCECAAETFRQVDPSLKLTWHATDGAVLVPGDVVMEVTGALRPILTAERTALNFLGHLSGIATLTAQFVAAAHARHPEVRVLDTRKTTPGLRLLEKAAVRAGGGTNHRSSLSEAVLVKDNHLAGISIADAVAQARALWPGRQIEVEADTVEQVGEVARAGADVVLLDNMDPRAVADAIAIAHGEAAGPILTEVSGNITLENIGDYAAAGPDWISSGSLTHSATVLDLGLDLIWRGA